MFKIIKKENINIEELKRLKDDGIRPILLGEFTDEEKQLYYAMGIYDIASTEGEAQYLAGEPTKYDSIKIRDNRKTAEKVVYKDKEVSKPGLFKKPVKLALAGVSIITIIGCGGLMAFGFSNNIIETPNITATSTQKKEIDISDSKGTSLAAEKEWIVEKVTAVKQNQETLSANNSSQTLDIDKYKEVIEASTEEKEIIYANSIEEAIEISDNNEDVIVAVENPNKIPSNEENSTTDVVNNATPDEDVSYEVSVPDEITFDEGTLNGAVAEDETFEVVVGDETVEIPLEDATAESSKDIDLSLGD